MKSYYILITVNVILLMVTLLSPVYAQAPNLTEPKEIRYIFIVSQSTNMGSADIDRESGRFKAVADSIGYLASFQNYFLDRVNPNITISASVIYFNDQQAVPLNFNVMNSPQPWIDLKIFQDRESDLKDALGKWQEALTECKFSPILCNSGGANYVGAAQKARDLLNARPGQNNVNTVLIYVGDGIPCGNILGFSCTYPAPVEAQIPSALDHIKQVTNFLKNELIGGSVGNLQTYSVMTGSVYNDYFRGAWKEAVGEQHAVELQPGTMSRFLWPVLQQIINQSILDSQVLPDSVSFERFNEFGYLEKFANDDYSMPPLLADWGMFNGSPEEVQIGNESAAADTLGTGIQHWAMKNPSANTYRIQKKSNSIFIPYSPMSPRLGAVGVFILQHPVSWEMRLLTQNTYQAAVSNGYQFFSLPQPGMDLYQFQLLKVVGRFAPSVNAQNVQVTMYACLVGSATPCQSVQLKPISGLNPVVFEGDFYPVYNGNYRVNFQFAVPGTSASGLTLPLAGETIDQYTALSVDVSMGFVCPPTDLFLGERWEMTIPVTAATSDTRTQLTAQELLDSIDLRINPLPLNGSPRDPIYRSNTMPERIILSGIVQLNDYFSISVDPVTKDGLYPLKNASPGGFNSTCSIRMRVINAQLRFRSGSGLLGGGATFKSGQPLIVDIIISNLEEANWIVNNTVRLYWEIQNAQMGPMHGYVAWAHNQQGTLMAPPGSVSFLFDFNTLSPTLTAGSYMIDFWLEIPAREGLEQNRLKLFDSAIPFIIQP